MGSPQMGFVNPITYCTVGKILLRKKESNQSYAVNFVVTYAVNFVVTYARLEGVPQARPPHGGPERVRRVALESG